jgi:hypothetical protein
LIPTQRVETSTTPKSRWVCSEPGSGFPNWPKLEYSSAPTAQVWLRSRLTFSAGWNSGFQASLPASGMSTMGLKDT